MNENFTAIQARDCTLIIQDRQAHTKIQGKFDSQTHKRTNKQRNTHRDRETSPQWPH